MTATTYLQTQAAEPCCTRSLLAQGILWAESSCRIDGTMAMALRNATADRGARLLDLVALECNTMADACHWLNANRSMVLDTLS